MPIILPGATPATRGPAPDARPAFNGNGREFVGLCARGAVFQLFTFGFYRFWLATDIRRHLWSRTSINGEPFEYTGRARELLIGFLIALAILAPVQVAYFLAGLRAEQAQAFASLPLSLFYILFGQFAVYRARRYRLTRTVWRGVRFWMSGSGWAYAFRWLGWGLLVLFTLGLVYPWMRASLERYKMKHTYYGDLKGDFTGRGSEFFRRGFLIWLVCVAPLAMLIAGGVMTSPVGAAKGLRESGLVLASAGGLWMLAIPFVWPYFRALEWRWWAAGARFGELSLSCGLRGGSLLKNYLKVFFLSLLVLVCGGLLLAVAGLMLKGAFGGALDFTRLENLDANNFWRAAPLIVAAAVGYLALLLAVGVVQRFYLTREVWRMIAVSIAVSRPDAVDGVAARGEAANALGEGLADGLDVAGL